MSNEQNVEIQRLVDRKEDRFPNARHYDKYAGVDLIEGNRTFLANQRLQTWFVKEKALLKCHSVPAKSHRLHKLVLRKMAKDSYVINGLVTGPETLVPLRLSGIFMRLDLFLNAVSSIGAYHTFETSGKLLKSTRAYSMLRSLCQHIFEGTMRSKQMNSVVIVFAEVPRD